MAGPYSLTAHFSSKQNHIPYNSPSERGLRKVNRVFVLPTGPQTPAFMMRIIKREIKPPAQDAPHGLGVFQQPANAGKPCKKSSQTMAFEITWTFTECNY
jgi:hypothetical protein